MSSAVTVERVDGVQIITINRPQARNAVNVEVAEGIASALDELDQDGEIDIAVLTGAGGCFCAGMDLKAFAATGARPHAGGRGFGGVCEKPPVKPLIAAVEGYALAGGFEIVLACDLVVAAENAKFGLPEVKRGLVPGGGGMLRLPRRIPFPIAMEVVLTGGMFTAVQFHQYGLVNRVAKEGGALACALDLAREIRRNGPLAVRTAKRVMMQSPDWAQATMFDSQRPMLAEVMASEDAREGARAFAEKRPPVWKGR